MTEPSIFTKIIQGEIPCHKVYEDESVIAFLDIHPQIEGHVLVVPKQQIDHIWDTPDDLYVHLWDVAKRVQQKIKAVYDPPRVGAAVEGFGVPHTHIHIMPIYNIEDLKRPQDILSEPDHAALAAVAKKLAIS